MDFMIVITLPTIQSAVCTERFTRNFNSVLLFSGRLELKAGLQYWGIAKGLFNAIAA